MCRSIKTLFNLDPPIANDEIRNAARQYVRKISGFREPSRANDAAFTAAVDEIAAASARLLTSLGTPAVPKDRLAEAGKAKARSARRFGRVDDGEAPLALAARQR